MVLRTKPGPDGTRARNHAKFIAIDHQFLLVTSANFSMIAEHRNVELGIRVDDPIVTRAIEKQMRALEDDLYEQVSYTSAPTALVGPDKNASLPVST
ncbi:MAG: phospholipase D-like domain-containing protein [Bifidobacteriaceae bacterium]|nr:phospholipase D-like domain-containing protein [Bifidobacteriaceae bacterium]